MNLMILVDHLADAWRWWTVPGALVGTLLLGPRALVLLEAWWDGDLAEEESTVLSPGARLATTLFALLFMLGAMIAGAIIPLANDGRLAEFTRDSALYRQAMASVWLLWGSGCWGISIALAPRSSPMAGSSVAMWFVAFVAATGSAGANM